MGGAESRVLEFETPNAESVTGPYRAQRHDRQRLPGDGPGWIRWERDRHPLGTKPGRKFMEDARRSRENRTCDLHFFNREVGQPSVSIPFRHCFAPAARRAALGAAFRGKAAKKRDCGLTGTRTQNQPRKHSGLLY